MVTVWLHFGIDKKTRTVERVDVFSQPTLASEQLVWVPAEKITASTPRAAFELARTVAMQKYPWLREQMSW